MQLRVHCNDAKFYIAVNPEENLLDLKNIIKSVYKKSYPDQAPLKIKNLYDEKYYLIPNENHTWKVKTLFEPKAIVNVECEQPDLSEPVKSSIVEEEEKVNDSDEEEQIVLNDAAASKSIEKNHKEDQSIVGEELENHDRSKYK